VNFVVIGTDHRMQHSEFGFEALLRAWLDKPRYLEQITAVAEEYHKNLGQSVGQQLAKERNLKWYNVDMTTEEKQEAGILEEQRNRPGMFQEETCCRVPSDVVREDAWVRKLVGSASGTTLVICGYLHFESLVQKLRAQGHAVDKRVYLEAVPCIKQSGGE
jgi:uncharacterized protein YbaP (TraB family)